MTWYRMKIFLIVSFTIILLMIGFVRYFVFQRAPNLKFVAELIKIDINIAIKGHPFTDTQYKHIIAEDHQTSKGFRKEWLDEVEKGELSKILTSIENPVIRSKVRTLIEIVFQQEEELLRNLNSKEIALKSSNVYSNSSACIVHYIPERWGAITHELMMVYKADPLTDIAHRYTNRHLHMMIFESPKITKQECDDRVSK